MCSGNVLLRDKMRSGTEAPAQAAHPETPPSCPSPAQPPAATADDYKASIEKLLQGSLDVLGDRLSDRIMSMLKELKTMGGPMREAKMTEIRDAAQSEHVDLAKLFLYEKVESNPGTEGLKVEEKKGGGDSPDLDRLKR